MCGQAVIIDTVKKTQACGCNETSNATKKTVENYLHTLDFRENYEVLCLS